MPCYSPIKISLYFILPQLFTHLNKNSLKLPREHKTHCHILPCQQRKGKAAQQPNGTDICAIVYYIPSCRLKDIYVDIASGKNATGRKEYQQILWDCRRGEIDSDILEASMMLSIAASLSQAENESHSFLT